MKLQEALISFIKTWEELSKLPSSKSNKLLLAPYVEEFKSSLNLLLRKEHAKHLGTVRNVAIKRFNEVSVPIRVIGVSTKELKLVSFILVLLVLFDLSAKKNDDELNMLWVVIQLTTDPYAFHT